MKCDTETARQEGGMLWRLSLQAGSCCATFLCLVSNIEALAGYSVISRANTVHFESMLCLKLSQYLGLCKGCQGNCSQWLMNTEQGDSCHAGSTVMAEDNKLVVTAFGSCYRCSSATITTARD